MKKRKQRYRFSKSPWWASGFEYSIHDMKTGPHVTIALCASRHLARKITSLLNREEERGNKKRRKTES